MPRQAPQPAPLQSGTTHAYDKSSKWLIQHHGDSLLRLAGFRDLEWWRPLQAEVVQPRRLPDGLLEALLKGETDPSLFLLEIATYPERRLADQLAEDLMMVWMARRVLPDAVTIVLHPRGKAQSASSRRFESRHQLSRIAASWHVVNLWEVSADDLLRTDDVGLIPWVPLARFQRPVESILEECRERIERQARPRERQNLLVVTQVLARLRYNQRDLLKFLGGPNVMIESPLIQELLAERGQKDLLRVLRSRFGELPSELSEQVRSVTDNDRIDELIETAARCPDLKSFETKLRAAKRRRKRRS